MGLIFTYLALVIGVGVGWYNPVVGLMVYYLFAILRPESLWFWYFAGEGNRFSLLVAVSTLIGWAIKGLGGAGSFTGIKLPMFGLGLYLLSGLFASMGALNSEVAWFWYQNQLKIGLMALVTVMLVKDERPIRVFAWTIVAGIAYLAYVFNSHYVFEGWNRLHYRGFGGIDNNGVAMIMAMGVPLAFFLGIYQKQLWVKAATFFGVACMVHVILFSFSRGGQVALCMAGGMIFVISMLTLPKKGLVLVVTLVFVLLTLRLAGAEVRERFFSTFVNREELDGSAASRFETWSAAVACIQANPLGVGPRNFNLIADHYGLARGKSVHNLFLQIGADYGVLGMAGLALFYFGSMYQTLLLLRSKVAKKLGWPMFFGQMVCISLGAFLVASQFIGVESVETGYIIALLGLCTVSHVRRLEAQQAKPKAEEDEPALEPPTVPAETFDPTWQPAERF